MLHSIPCAPVQTPTMETVLLVMEDTPSQLADVSFPPILNLLTFYAEDGMPLVFASNAPTMPISDKTCVSLLMLSAEPSMPKTETVSLAMLDTSSRAEDV